MTSSAKDKDGVSQPTTGDRHPPRPSQNNNNTSTTTTTTTISTTTTMRASSDLQSQLSREPENNNISSLILPQRSTASHSKVQSSQLVAAISEPATVEASAFRILPMINNALDNSASNSSATSHHSNHNNANSNNNNSSSSNNNNTNNLNSINSSSSSTLIPGGASQLDDSNISSIPVTPSNEISNPLSRHPLRSKKSTVNKPVISNDSINIQQDQYIQEQQHHQQQQQQEALDEMQREQRQDTQRHQDQLDQSLVSSKDHSSLSATGNNDAPRSHDTNDVTNSLRPKKTTSTLLSAQSVNNLRSVTDHNGSISSSSSLNPNGGQINQSTSNSNLSTNANTITSLSSVASSRAEHFAAKIHSAIKEDEKTSDSDESFVYETTANPKTTTPVPNNTVNSNSSLKLPSTTAVHHSVHVVSPLAQPIIPDVYHSEVPTTPSAIVHHTEDTSTVSAKNIPIESDSASEMAAQSSPVSQTKYAVGSTNSNTSTVVNQMNASTSTTAPNHDDLKIDNKSELASQSDTYVNNFDSTNSQTDLNQSAYLSKPLLKSTKSNYGMNGSIGISNNDANIDDGSNFDSRSRRLSKTALDPLSISQYQPQPQQHSPLLHNTTPSNDVNNKLREITNKVFDSKGTLPRRYSGLDVNDFSVDDIDDDFDEEGLIGLNQYHYGHNSNTATSNSQQFNSTIPSEIDFRHNFEFGLNEPLLKGKPGYNSVGHHYGSIGNGTLQSGEGHSPNQPYFNSYNSNNGNVNNNEQFNSYGTALYSNGSTTNNPNMQNNGNSNGNQQRLLRSNKHRQDLYFSPHNFTSARAARLKQLKNFCYTVSLIFLLVSMGFISGFILATTKELQRARIVEINEILISQEELVFNMAVESFNPGFLSIVIQDVELDVFAKSKHVSDEVLYSSEEQRNSLVVVDNNNHNMAKDFSDSDSDSDSDSKYSTVLLGTLTHLDIPLVFQGGFFTRDEGLSITEIKILNPCSHKPSTNDTSMSVEQGMASESLALSVSEDPNEFDDLFPAITLNEVDDIGKRQWLNISKSKFDLIIRGSLTYQLPISNSNRTIGVNKVVPIDPNNLPKHGEGLSNFYDHDDDGEDDDHRHGDLGLGRLYLGEHRFLHDIDRVN